MENCAIESKKPAILLGVTGGIAAYKAAELTRLLVQANYTVHVVMSEAATHFIQPATFQALSGQRVWTSLWDSRIENQMAHIALARSVDLILVAPATAHFMAKVANGLADDLLSTLCCARENPLWLAPAMNRQMWDNLPNQRHVKQLMDDGVVLLGPDKGEQACGETGMGRMLEPEALCTHIDTYFEQRAGAKQPLSGVRVLITAGPTQERIDPVRCLTNNSSGKMGYALAEAAQRSGALVTLISGPCNLASPLGVAHVSVHSAADMYAAVQDAVGHADIFIAAAAVADYTMRQPMPEKIKKTGESMTIELVPTVDILKHVAARVPAPFCVGFAAESQDMLANAEAKRKHKNVPLMVANDVSTIGSDENEVVLLEDSGRYTIPRAPKGVIAMAILRHVASRYAKQKP